MTTGSIAPTRPAAVQACLHGSDRWIRGRRHSDGLPFFAIPSSTADRIYYTTSTNCTCPDANQRQRVCKHSLAVEQFEAREAKALGLATPAEIDTAAAGIAADAQARQLAERRIHNAEVFERLYGADAA